MCAWCEPWEMREAAGGCVKHVRMRVNCACDGSGAAGDGEEEGREEEQRSESESRLYGAEFLIII